MAVTLPIVPAGGAEVAPLTSAPGSRAKHKGAVHRGGDAKKSVVLLQQGVWDMPLESMPLAAGYLKSTALTDDRVKSMMDIEIVNIRGAVTRAKMANELYSDGAPDILACSVLGWNFHSFGALAETFKQLNPDGWVVFGGTHVAHQAERVFRLYPQVDVVVNGEGEFVFLDLLRSYLDGVGRHELHAITGISFQDNEGDTVTTADRDRIENLDVIPSPVLTGAIELTDANGDFRYDVALMETNRGCPYKCSFCYWGGATGQRVRAFSRERLRQELELYAKHKVHTIVSCDANFGLLPIDEEFIDDMIEVRNQYGYPRALEGSWAKNKSKTFYSIVRKMKQNGMRTSFTLALQTLSDEALGTMNRRNMKVNDWEDLAEWLDNEGLDCYAELIWGAPGETVESFMRGYDRLSAHVSRIAVYPLLMLPNTEYFEKRDEYGIVSVHGDNDDFEYVLAHQTMSFAENQQMARFIFWARTLAENAVLRHTWVGLRGLGGLSQSEAILDFERWINENTDEQTAVLRSAVTKAVGGLDALSEALTYLFRTHEAELLLRRWWNESLRPKAEPSTVAVLDEIFNYDLLTLPVCHKGDADEDDEELPLAEVRGEPYYLRADVELAYDVPAILAALRAGDEPPLTRRPTKVNLYYRTGADNFAGSTNHEEIVHHMALTEAEVLAAAAADVAAAEPVRNPVPALTKDHAGCA